MPVPKPKKPKKMPGQKPKKFSLVGMTRMGLKFWLPQRRPPKRKKAA